MYLCIYLSIWKYLSTYVLVDGYECSIASTKRAFLPNSNLAMKEASLRRGLQTKNQEYTYHLATSLTIS